MIPSRSYIVSQMPPAIGVSYIEKQNADNPDIIRAIEKNYPEAVRLSENIARSFKDETYRDTAKNIWQFLREQIKYEADPTAKQKIRLPNRFIADAKGDCKSFALFTASVLSNLGMFVAFRFASYRLFNTTPTHVYVVTKDEQGKEIIIDGVWNKFNAQKPYSFKRDIVMTVSTLAGIGDCPDDVKSYRDRLIMLLSSPVITVAKKQLIREAINDIDNRCAAVNEATDSYMEHLDGIGKVTGKGIFLAPSRNAFLALAALNVRGIAHKLAYAIYKNKAATKNWWEKLGGDFSKLEGTVNKAKDKNPFLGEKNKSLYYIPTGADLQAEANAASSTGNAPVFSSLAEANAYRTSHNIQGIGDVAAGTAALLAAAAPVVASVAAFVKALTGKQDSDLDGFIDDASGAGGNTTIPDGPILDGETSGFGGIPTIALYLGGGFLALKLLKII